MTSRKSTKTRPPQKKTSRPGPSKRKKSVKDSAAAAAAVIKPSPEPDLTIKEAPDLPALLHYIRQGRCALFVGAGLSAGAGLPTWRGLMMRIIRQATPLAISPENADEPAKAKKGKDKIDPARREELDERVQRDTETAKELTSLLDAGKFAELAGYCRDLMGRREFHAELQRALEAPGDIPETHHAIVDTPYACIVTTNYDTLLEDAYASWSTRGVPKAPTGAELAQQGTLLFDEVFFILKAHGDLNDEASIVLTSEDYRRIIHSSPAFQATLGGVLQRYAVLFVGYSLSDVNFRLLLDNQLTIFNEYVPPRYAIMEAVSEAEKEILWRTAKLRVINYPQGEHKVVGNFLRTIAKQTVTPPTTEKRSARVTEPVRVMPRPRPVRHVDLEISASGERLAIRFEQEASAGVQESIWSGGSQWPDWESLRLSLSEVIAGHLGLAKVNAIGAQLERAMPDELLRCLEATRPGIPVMLSLSSATETIPWEWTIVEGSPLCLRNPVIRRPTGISDRSRGLRLAGTPLRALLIGDAGAGDKSAGAHLPGAARETESIAKLLTDKGHEVTLLSREQAVYSRLVEEVEQGEYDIIHFAGHAWYEREEGLLYLWDGRVSSSELASIFNRRPPVLLVLNSHYTAFAPCGIVFNNARSANGTSPPGVNHPLPPPLGFMGLASRSGVGAFVGCFSGYVLDDSACQVAITLYEKLLYGFNFAFSLHEARKKVTNVTDTTGLFYIGSGYGEVTLASMQR